MLLTSDFDYELPPELIAQYPLPGRDQSRLLVLDRHLPTLSHLQFPDIGRFLREGDLLVLNDSRVFPARIRGRKSGSTTRFEVLLVSENCTNDWWVMLKPGKRLRPTEQIILSDLQGHPTEIHATLQEKNDEGHCRLTFSGVQNIVHAVQKIGEVPLPPYIQRNAPVEWDQDKERYQTVYAKEPGSVAAPTAGLHFTDALLEQLQNRGIQTTTVTLHVGLGTFAPVKSDRLEDHTMHTEFYSVSEEAAGMIQKALDEGRRVVAVGTTSVRVLETVARTVEGFSQGSEGRTKIFIYPPFKFKIVDALITNFHMPKSTLLMLVSAFAAPGSTQGRDRILNAYQEAIQRQYRFFSYGDAMMIL